MLKKTLIYLGLGPDDEYDSFDEYAPIDAGFEGSGVQAAPASANPRPVPVSYTHLTLPTTPYV